MNTDLEGTRRRIKAEKHFMGVMYGLLAGLVFSLALWGYDATLLWGASVEYPWIKLAVGMPLAILIGGVAGWLTAQLDHGLVGFLSWGLAGVGYVWLGSHTPFEGVSWLVGWLRPELRGLDVYPFVESARVRMIFLYPFVAILTGLGGVLQLPIVEGALRSRYQAGRYFALLALLPVYLAIGLLADNLINIPLREPLLGVDNRIQLRLQAEASGMPADEMRRRGLRVVETFGDLYHQPYRQLLGNYDAESITEVNVILNFNGVWGSCSVVAGSPGFCQLSTDRFLKKVACRLAGGDGETCQIGIAPEAESQVQAVQAQFGPAPELAIETQFGNVVLVRGRGAGEAQFSCRLRVTRGLVIESCQPLPGLVSLPFRVFPTETPRPDRTATAAPPGVEEASPTAALPLVIPLPTSADLAPRYDLHLNIADDLRSFSGQARVVYTNTETIPLDFLYFRLLPNGQGSYGDGSLLVGQVTVAGQPARTELSVQDSALQVFLPAALAPGQSLQVSMAFTGTVPVDFGPGYGIYNLTEGVLALSGWFPILAVYDEDGWNLDPVSIIGDSVYSEAAYYRVDLTAPAGLVWAATGSVVNQAQEGACVRYYLDGGLARDFFLIASPDYQVAHQAVGETTVQVFYPSSLETGARQALAIGAESVRIFNEKFGPYPYRELDIVAAPMQYALGVEFPGIVLVASDLYAEPGAGSFVVTVAHEVAHQWWYAVVGNDVFDEPWLDEGLVTYSSSFYYEFRPGGGAPVPLYQYWQDRYDRLVEAGKDDLVTASLAHFEALGESSIYSTVVYVKGALFFKALREEIGDQAFFAALQAYYRDYQFGVATGEVLLGYFEQAAGRALDDFYQQWLYERGA